jgi:hypothetical protein
MNPPELSIAVGIPKDSVVRCETALKADKFLLVMNTDRDGAARARAVLGVAMNDFSPSVAAP